MAGAAHARPTSVKIGTCILRAWLRWQRVAHNQLIGPTEWRAVDGVISIH